MQDKFEKNSGRAVGRELLYFLGGAALGAISVGHDRISNVTQPIENNVRLDKIANAFLARQSVLISDVYKPDKRYAQMRHQADHWHGTGRYYTDVGGGKIDVLEGIIRHGKLTPAPDVTDHNNGLAHIVAASPNRMHARIYADIHMYQLDGLNRYGSTHFWSGVFAGRILRSMTNDKSFGTFVSYNARNAIRTGQVRQPRIQQESVMGIKSILNGSDIPDNYPMLIGIKNNGTHTIKHLHEVRYPEVPASHFSHIEVPAEKVGEVSDILKRGHYNVSVTAIETGEIAASQQPFTTLISTF